jgi:hypothetical protein
MSMEEFGDLFFVARDVRQKAFELLRHRYTHTAYSGFERRVLGLQVTRMLIRFLLGLPILDM